MKKLFSFLFIALSITSFAGTVDTIAVYSNSMKKTIKCVVIKPDNYKKKKSVFPTVYLLHGYSGAFDNWIKKVPELKQHADTYQTLIVCPDGAYSSWYFDSPVDSTLKYETAIAEELPKYIDARYRTIKDRNARAITGLSMGGHGGLFLGFRHASTFGACGSMSGAFLIEYITKNYQIDKVLGDTTNKERYRNYSIVKEMENYPKDSLAILIDCGTEDFIIEMSRAVHQKMLALKIPHDYTERPGKHDWKYWATAIEYQFVFFRNFFDKQLHKNRQNKLTL